MTFVDLIYNLHYIFKAYEVQFLPIKNQDYRSSYMGSNLIPEAHMCGKESSRPIINRIHNEMDETRSNKLNKYSYYRKK